MTFNKVHVQQLRKVIVGIMADAVGDTSDERVWPIRRARYLEAITALDATKDELQLDIKALVKTFCPTIRVLQYSASGTDIYALEVTMPFCNEHACVHLISDKMAKDLIRIGIACESGMLEYLLEEKNDEDV